MKICLFFLCAILAVFTISRADECNMDGHTFKVGETYSIPGKCTLAKCTGANKFTLKICASVSSLTGREQNPQDNSKPYPECCPY